MITKIQLEFIKKTKPQKYKLTLTDELGIEDISEGLAATVLASITANMSIAEFDDSSDMITKQGI